MPIDVSQIGPVEILAVGFPGSHFNGDVLPSIAELVDKGLIRVLDIVVVKKEADGTINAIEIENLDDEDAAHLTTLQTAGIEVLADDDFSLAGDVIPSGTTAVLLVWEDIWAKRVAAAIRESGGVLLAHERVPHEVVGELLNDEEGD